MILLKFNIVNFNTLIYTFALLIFLHNTLFADTQNRKPEIIGQQQLSINEDQFITINLYHLNVRDRDNWYPWGFTLKIHGGTNYTFSGTTVTPTLHFYGTLHVAVTVNDGKHESDIYTMIITVNAVNDPPEIVTQNPLTTFQNKPIVLQYTDLVVTDPDHHYPDGFTLTISPGNNYTVHGNQITPSSNFTGTLTVRVAVNDGVSSSEPFNVIVQVKLANSTPEIIGQIPLSMKEDESLAVQFSHLTVIDQDSPYPKGFSLSIAPGAHYSVTGNTIKPVTNFNGTLKVALTITDNDKNTSNPFYLVITVTPVNDAPIILQLESEPINYSTGNGLVMISQNFDAFDPDGDSLIMAEVGIRPETYKAGDDELVFANTVAIKGSFDVASGVLALWGKATLQEYVKAIRSIRYQHHNGPSSEIRRLYIILNDGISSSVAKERHILFATSSIDLDIPTGFTPNGDRANDTWSIKSLKDTDNYATIVVRVYSKTGQLVYETTGVNKEWDGRYNGALLPPDVYFYTIDLKDAAHTKIVTGIVTILR
jgi:gliding motility-associated-like protein